MRKSHFPVDFRGQREKGKTYLAGLAPVPGKAGTAHKLLREPGQIDLENFVNHNFPVFKSALQV
jgi:hypothetical protein